MSSRLSIWCTLLVLLIVLSAASLCLGTTDITQLDADTARYILLELRLPALLMALAAGIGLSLSGLVMQTVMGNPLADPSLLGVSAGASLGSGIALMVMGGSLTGGQLSAGGFALTMGLALAGALIVTGILVLCSGIVSQRTTLLLVGVMLSFMISSIVGTLNYFASADALKSFVVWGLGSLSGVVRSWALLSLCISLASGLLLLLLQRPLDALLLGETHATTVGYSLRRTRTVLLCVASLLTALITALCGPIAFVGLAVPHAARLLWRTSQHGTLIPACTLLGALVLVGCHLLCQLPALWDVGSILPINVLTPLLGAPVVMGILLSRK